jgi:hypothetical protein
VLPPPEDDVAVNPVAGGLDLRLDSEGPSKCEHEGTDWSRGESGDDEVTAGN